MFKPQKYSLLVASLLLGVSLTPVIAQKAPTKPDHLGPFKLVSYNDIKLWTRGKNYYGVLFSDGTHLIHIDSAQYELFALHIETVMVAPKLKPTKVDSTGNVKVIVRNQVTGDTTTVTADRALYTATADPKDRGKVNLTGHVHAEQTNKELAQPFVLNNADTGTIEFLADGNIQVEIGSAHGDSTITGQPYEPESKGKQP